MKETPSPNGDNGDRDARGRFAKGNRAGPGNPQCVQVAKLRQAAMNAVPVERLERIFDALATRAENGDVKAAKVVLAYTIGKPVDVTTNERREESEAFAARFGRLEDLLPPSAPFHGQLLE